MNDDRRHAQNDQLLRECFGPFGQRIARIIVGLESRGFKPRVNQAWRSPALQLAAFNSGHSKVKWGFHNATAPDGRPEALAVDLFSEDYPEPADNQHLWPESFRHYLLTLGSLAASQQLETGLDWGLDSDERRVLGIALANDPLSYVGELGWDPTHVEPRDLTVSAARAGKRPAW